MNNHLITYLIGTHKEMLHTEREEQLKEGIRRAIEKCDWEETQRLLRDQREAMEDSFSEGLVEVDTHYFGTFLYAGIAFGTLAVAPLPGMALLCDSAMRAYRMLKESTPIGIVGTARELLEKK